LEFDKKGNVRFTSTSAKGYARDITSKMELRYIKHKSEILNAGKRDAVTKKTLPDGRIRYYKQERPAATPGLTRGQRDVVEHNPKTGEVRQWNEDVNHAGEVKIVHPKSINGVEIKTKHYHFTENGIERF
jgi:hypothetical protein